MDVGPHMDLTGRIIASVRAKGLYMGLYHSLKEWYNPLYEQVRVPDVVICGGTSLFWTSGVQTPLYSVCLLCTLSWGVQNKGTLLQ